jgi:hypothetical protein
MASVISVRKVQKFRVWPFRLLLYFLATKAPRLQDFHQEEFFMMPKKSVLNIKKTVIAAEQTGWNSPGEITYLTMKV